MFTRDLERNHMMDESEEGPDLYDSGLTFTVHMPDGESFKAPLIRQAGEYTKKRKPFNELANKGLFFG
jgi:hypothetical protein